MVARWSRFAQSCYRLLAAAGGLLRQSLGCLQMFLQRRQCILGKPSHRISLLGFFLKYFDVFLMVFDHGFDEGAVEACTGQHLEFQIGGLLADARARRRRDAELGRDLSGLLIVGGVTSI